MALVAKPGGPAGPTSHDVVDRVRRTVGTDRGHAENVLREADRLIEAADGARIVDTSTSFF